MPSCWRVRREAGRRQNTGNGAATSIALGLGSLGPTSRYTSRSLGVIKLLGLLALPLYALLQFIDLPFLIVSAEWEPLTTYQIALALKLPFASVVIVLVLLARANSGREEVVLQMLLAGLDAGVAVLDTREHSERLLTLQGGPLRGADGSRAADRSSVEEFGTVPLSEDDQVRLLRAARGPLPAETTATLDSGLAVVHLSPLARWTEVRPYFPELWDVPEKHLVALVILPVRNMHDLPIAPEDVKRMLDPVRESFHELARPIGLVSMLLSELVGNRRLERALNSTAPAAWEDLRFAEVQINRFLFPQVRYLGIVGKVRSLLDVLPDEAPVPLVPAVRQTIEDFLAVLLRVRGADNFSVLKVPDHALSLAERHELWSLDAAPGSEAALARFPKEVLWLVVSELLLNAIRHLPPDAAAVAAHRPRRRPVSVRALLPEETRVSLEFTNLFIPDARIEDSAHFQRGVLARPLGGVASVRRLLESIGWRMRFSVDDIDGRAADFTVSLDGPVATAAGSWRRSPRTRSSSSGSRRGRWVSRSRGCASGVPRCWA